MALPTAASVVSAGLGSYPTVYYDRKAVAALEKSLFLYQGCDQKPMPDKSGVAMQIFDYSAMSANTTAVDGRHALRRADLDAEHPHHQPVTVR
jgi:hypothetical protein